MAMAFNIPHACVDTLFVYVCFMSWTDVANIQIRIKALTLKHCCDESSAGVELTIRNWTSSWSRWIISLRMHAIFISAIHGRNPLAIINGNILSISVMLIHHYVPQKYEHNTISILSMVSKFPLHIAEMLDIYDYVGFWYIVILLEDAITISRAAFV